ncbi:tetratricopeptide repeat protein [Dongia sp.]|uniref:tetratricopeptide repeat protein n=1 Tax=Dongia sp. TaxID=1977262 RepID=UPI0035B1CD74
MPSAAPRRGNCDRRHGAGRAVAAVVARAAKIGNSPAMSSTRFTSRLLAVALLLATLQPFAAAPVFAAQADLEEVLKMELEGDKVGAYLRLKELAPTGDPEAQYKLGGYYQYGWAGPTNFALAREWYGRAAHQGHADAMLGLAVMDTQGQGAPVNNKSAFTWLTIAASIFKEPDIVKTVAGLRNKLKSELSSADLNAALAEAMAFQAVKEQP